MSKILVAPLEALTDPELTDQERRVLLALFSYSCLLYTSPSPRD